MPTSIRKNILNVKKSRQLGFAPIIVVVLLTVIAGSSILIIRNIPFNQPKLNPEPEIEQSTSSPQIKASSSPVISKKTTAPTAAPKKATPVPSTNTTSTNSTANNSNTSNNSSNSAPTNTPAPTNISIPTTGTLKGIVKDSSGNPIANASMELSCSGCGKLRNGDVQSEQADGGGNYNISNLPAISINIKAFSGHWGEVKTVSIIGGQTTSLDLTVGADTTAKPSISITKGPYSSGGQSPCFDVTASHANCYQLSASFATDNGTYSNANLTSGGGCSYVGTICTNINGSHTFKVKARTVSTNTESDVVSLPYSAP